jgi:hypothetical protein
MLGTLDQMALKPIVIVGGETARALADHELFARLRSASSVSMAVMCASIGTHAGESGQTKARLTARSRLARSSSLAVSLLTSWLRMSEPHSVCLLSFRLRELVTHESQYRGLRSLEERDSVPKLTQVGV